MELKLIFQGVMACMMVASPGAAALFINNLNMDLIPKKGVHYEEIVNQTAGRKVYTLSMIQVTIPRESGKEVPVNDGSLLYSPQKLVLNSQERGGFKFYYKGQDDNQERYFKIKFIETPLGMDILHNNKNTLLFDYQVAVEAIMVVRPRVEEFHYKYQHDKIINAGNTYFKYMSSKNCANEYSHSKFVAPGEHASLAGEMAEENRVIIYKNRIIVLSQCHQGN